MAERVPEKSEATYLFIMIGK